MSDFYIADTNVIKLYAGEKMERLTGYICINSVTLRKVYWDILRDLYFYEHTTQSYT